MLRLELQITEASASAVEPQVPIETTAAAIALLDAQSPWLRGAERRLSKPVPSVPRRGLSSDQLKFWAMPGFLHQKREVVNPVVSAHTARINHVGQIVPRVAEDEVSMRN